MMRASNTVSFYRVTAKVSGRTRQPPSPARHPTMASSNSLLSRSLRRITSVSPMACNASACRLITRHPPIRSSPSRLFSSSPSSSFSPPLGKPSSNWSTMTHRHPQQRRVGHSISKKSKNSQPQPQPRRDRQQAANASSSRRQQATMAMGRQQQQQQQQTFHQQQQQQQQFISLRDKINLFLNQPRSLPIPRWISPQRVTFTYSEMFGHASFLLVAISYAVDDHLQLRLIAIAGSSAMLVFTFFHPHGRPLFLPFKWNLLFILLNSWRVARVYFDRFRGEQFMSDSLYRNIFEHHFSVMDKTDFARLLRLGTKEIFHKGDVVVQQDADNRYVRLVLRGDLNVERDGQITYMLHEGQFISESGLHAGLGLRGSVPSCCTVSAATDNVEVLRWDRTELMRLLELHKSIERALKAVMSWDIVSKLKSQRSLLASGKITDVERWTEKRREQTLARYKAILQNMLSHPDYLNKRKGNLAKYREIHHIEMSEHVIALEEMDWTVAEFEAGVKDGQLDADKLEKKTMGWKWWIHSWWNAL